MSFSDFSAADHAALAAHGLTLQEAARQLRLLREPPRPVRLVRPCTIGDGIHTISESERPALRSAADVAALDSRVTKFVPASGAATRMFRDLIAIVDGDRRPSQTPEGRTFFDRFDHFPFAEELRHRARSANPAGTEDEERRVLRTLLYEMRYAELPKALIAFHRAGSIRTPFEEHLLEGARYTRTRANAAVSHFTVAPEFRHEFEQALQALAGSASTHTGGTRFEVSFSEQHPHTDTLAITPSGEVFRTADGSLLFRPAGHGALLENLNALDGDLVVLKNIDNVVPFERSDEVVEWKRLLIGYSSTLHHALADRWRRAESPAEREELDRPLRVCGVVRNEGEPGGAPFWIEDAAGRQSMQIVESSQVDMSDPAQRRIFESSSHFNPVDIVCALRRHDGGQHDLTRFVDEHAVFRARKSHEGRELVALERPGLWNGAMASWTTVFVEVPASTFAPVKTVFDLLRPQHQSL
jgi:hypothetical protein